MTTFTFKDWEATEEKIAVLEEVIEKELSKAEPLNKRIREGLSDLHHSDSRAEAEEAKRRTNDALALRDKFVKKYVAPFEDELLILKERKSKMKSLEVHKLKGTADMQ